jgi:hypothetical protein
MCSADTDPEAERVQISLLREASVQQRLSLAQSLTEMTMQLAWRAIERSNPEADADELAVKFVTHCYGQTLGDGLRRDLEVRRHFLPS